MKNRNYPLSAVVALTLSWLAPLASAQSIYTPYAFTNFAGQPGGPGKADGTGTTARFRGPDGVAADSSGNLYVADSVNFTIRKITPAGEVTTLAGSPGQIGTNDGPGISARFGSVYGGPTGIAVDGAGNVFVADTQNYTVRKITPDGVVSTVAGSPAQAGAADGTNSTARFSSPTGLATDTAGNVYVADSFAIRRVAPVGSDWVVTTLAGSAFLSGAVDGAGGVARFGTPSAGGLGGPPRGLAVDPATNIYVADFGNGTIRRVAPDGSGWVVSTLAGTAGLYGTLDGLNGSARFTYSGPYGIAVDHTGILYVPDAAALTVRKIVFDGVNWAVTTLAGSPTLVGTADGDGPAARFSYLKGAATDKAGNVYVADFQNSTIRKITPGGSVTTFAGLAGGPGSSDGMGNTAQFYLPHGVALDSATNLYVADTQNHIIRQISPAGVVTTIAGKAGKHGTTDGANGTARFYQPRGMAVDGAGNLYVNDFQSSTIRKITHSGADWIVTTIAGSPGVTGTNDGPGLTARFSQPLDLAADHDGNVYVADTSNLTIRKLTPSGADWTVTTLAGSPGKQGIVDATGSDARFSGPHGLAVDGAGVLFVADGYSIRRITTGGEVTTLAGCPAGGCTNAIGNADGPAITARFGLPGGLAVDGTGNIYVADFSNDTIRKLTLSGTEWTVTTLAGVTGQASAADGIGSTARFNGPFGVAVDGAGTLYVADSGENRIAKGTSATAQATLQFDTAGGNLIVSNGALLLKLSGPTGSRAAVDATTDFLTWSPIQTNSIPATGLDLSVPLGTNHYLFLRARLVP